MSYAAVKLLINLVRCSLVVNLPLVLCESTYSATPGQYRIGACRQGTLSVTHLIPPRKRADTRKTEHVYVVGGCATGRITVDPATGDGNRLQIRY